MPNNLPVYLEDCFQIYQQQADFRSEHTRSAYKRAVELFFQFLDDRSQKQLPIQQKHYTTARHLAPQDFSKADTSALLHFAKWLTETPLYPNRSDKRPYAPATVELRVAGVYHWLGFMQKLNWLPQDFDLAMAYQQFREQSTTTSLEDKSVVKPLDSLEQLVAYYDHLSPPRYLLDDSDRLSHWELVRLRNRAFLHCLADTGGRVSELLSLNISHVPTGPMLRKTVAISVVGKSNHPYTIYMQKALPILRAYILERKHFQAHDPLFISHDPHYAGSRMSRIVAWRIVRRAALALDIGEISPQVFRHWRALQLISDGANPYEVRDVLGHRSVETVRALYADAWAKRDANS